MLSKKLAEYNIILASGSPRRQAFFKDLNLDFEIRLKEVEEVYPENLKGKEITEYLADLKSKPFDEELTEKDLLITSDTIVWLDGKALGKPKTYNEAFTTLKNLSNKSHDVITSISIKSKNFQKIVSDITKVYFKELTDDEINYYIENYQPYDKAGAYGIQEWIGKIGIQKIEGSYFTVMGLPTHKLYEELMQL
ncbi:septum formation inhibitor Maf [Tenacibaculum holothuriorum]|uniref:dTTP/UTP pyrophosphatase n=1 Tax=Tenacibaculum holothuriorum TaxID=1635173 RepID=A0A1Y2PHQ7_9FLAO|nr:Maf family nucleotide pyrophosphatase [Tenacibaculum holothuriorum]OSY89208.1 septum formation inhibitor Maf [Tenacibaculum holothuriorum]